MINKQPTEIKSNIKKKTEFIVLLLAMIGAILLTFRERVGVKKQSYINQISRDPSSSIELVEAKSNQGVKVDD